MKNTTGKIQQKEKYPHSTIELKWQSKWEAGRVYQPQFETAKVLKGKNTASTSQQSYNSTIAKPFYNLMMFPYPSAEGLHVGFSYTSGGIDAYGRFKRMSGYDVFEPIGLDGFGIHSENHAIKTNTHPVEHAKRTENNFYRQLHATGNAYAWDNKLETYDPEYYRWTQWIFVQLFKSGLAYKKNSPVNYCLSCKTVLSDEQVIDGHCERCDSVVEKRDLEQWFFKITHYADRLLNNIETLNWTDKIRLAQKNWIGKKSGITISYKIDGKNKTVTIFTTRPDTNFGATFIALAPEHELVKKLTNGEIIISDQIVKKIKAYVAKSKNKSEIERVAEGKDKTGVFTGLYAINPLTEYKMPIWISDFVLGGFGTGALVGVPGHDKRDFAFAQKFDLEIIRVVVGKDSDTSAITSLDQVQETEGTMINSGFLNGLDIHSATEKMMDHLEKEGYGNREVTYHLRDWLISRQRYWGPPIPMTYCESCAQRKPKVLVLHGLYGSEHENWLPWVKKTLQERGYDVLIPTLPNADNPTMEEWVAALEKLSLEQKDSISIVAHSLGAPAAISFIAKTKLTVKQLLLVAPTGKQQGEKNWENLRKVGASEASIKKIGQFNTIAQKDMSTVISSIWRTVLLLSDDDPYIPMNVSESYAALAPTILRFHKKGHFNVSAGVTELPELLTYFPKVSESNHGWNPVEENALPVKLPYIEDFKPLGTGKAPLASSETFYKTVCPKCGGEATRETDVSDTFLDSSWYFLRYLTTDWKDAPFPSEKYIRTKMDDTKGSKKEWEALLEDAKRRSQWLPVTSYIGGAEHSVLHLLYSRFVTMALYDMGYLDFEEPFTRFYAHGLIIKDGAKMSKSKGNVINPDEYIAKYGADTLRTYLLFLGPFDMGGDFRDSGIDGMHRFVRRVWKLLTSVSKTEENLTQERQKMMHQTIKGITEDMEQLHFNTSIAKLMTYYNFLAKQTDVYKSEAKIFLQLFAPFAPHLTEELWDMLGMQKEAIQKGEHWSIHRSSWPQYDASYLKEEAFIIAIQVNGKLRGTVTISVEEKENKDLIEKQARADRSVAKYFQNGIKKVIYIPGKIMNFVV